MNLEDLSILITCFNKINFLDNFKSQILKLVSFRVRIIIVDDGSTDGSTKYLRDNLEHISGVTILFTGNNGSAAARNLALKSAQTKFFVFWDIDDQIDINTLQIMYVEASRQNCVAVIANYSINDFLNPIKNTFLPEDSKNVEISKYRDELIGMLGYWRILYKLDHILLNSIEFHPTFKEVDNNYFILDDVFWLIEFYSIPGNIRLLDRNKVFYNYFTEINPPFTNWIKFQNQALLFPKAAFVNYLRVENKLDSDSLGWYKRTILDFTFRHLCYLNILQFVKSTKSFWDLLSAIQIKIFSIYSIKMHIKILTKVCKNSIYGLKYFYFRLSNSLMSRIVASK